MTREQAGIISARLRAFADGKTIQYPAGDGFNDWPGGGPTLATPMRAVLEARIKPEPVLRPWTEAEIEAECIKGTVLKYMDSIGPISKLGCDIRVGAQYIGEMSKAVTMLMKYGKVAATGAPCGVYE